MCVMQLTKKARDLLPGDKVWDIENDRVHAVVEVRSSDFSGKELKETGDITAVTFHDPIPHGFGPDQCGALLPSETEVRLVAN
jgi:hypothetical protein